MQNTGVLEAVVVDIRSMPNGLWHLFMSLKEIIRMPRSRLSFETKLNGRSSLNCMSIAFAQSTEIECCTGLKQKHALFYGSIQKLRQT